MSKIYSKNTPVPTNEGTVCNYVLTIVRKVYSPKAPLGPGIKIFNPKNITVYIFQHSC